MPTSPSPPRVTFVSSHAGRGGSERYLTLLLPALDPRWVGSVVSLEHGPLVDALTDRSFRVDVIPTPPRLIGIVRASRRLRRHLRACRPDVVHANGVKAAVVSALATLGTTVPVVWVKHDFSFDGTVARLIGRRCAAVVGVAGAVLETFRDTRVEGRTVVVHNGVRVRDLDRDRHRHILFEALGRPAGRAVLLVGRFDPSKGHREVLAIAPALVERLSDAVIAFVGPDDPAHPRYRASLADEIAKRGLEHAVVMLPHRDDVVSLMAGADAVVLPSLHTGGHGREAFPFVALEALSVGTPVVAYDGGGMPELLGDCGLLVAEGDRASLLRELCSVLEDGGLADELRARGLARIRSDFTPAGMRDGLMEVYLRVSARVSSTSA